MQYHGQKVFSRKDQDRQCNLDTLIPLTRYYPRSCRTRYTIYTGAVKRKVTNQQAVQFFVLLCTAGDASRVYTRGLFVTFALYQPEFTSSSSLPQSEGLVAAFSFAVSSFLAAACRCSRARDTMRVCTWLRSKTM